MNIESYTCKIIAFVILSFYFTPSLYSQTSLEGTTRKKPNYGAISLTTLNTWQDCAPPEAKCKTTLTTIEIADNSVNITADDIDDGSIAECGLQSLNISPAVFDCSSVDNIEEVTLTITDTNGDSDTCIALINVIDSTSPSINFEAIDIRLDSVRRTIKDDHKYNGFPTLLKTNKGTFIGTYRVGTSHFADGSIVLFRSENLLEFETQILHENPDTSGSYVGWYETILAEFNTDTIHAISSYSMPDSTITAVKVSTDDGETWITVDTIPHFYASKKQRFGPSKGINRNNRWIFPIYGIKGVGVTSYTSGILYSDDRGASWNLSEFSPDTLLKLDEASLLEISDTLVAFVRSEQTDEERLYRTYSIDNGSSWSVPEQIILEKWRRSHPSTILLPDGTILLEGRNLAELGLEYRRPVVWQSSDNGRSFERIDFLDMQGYGMYSSFEFIGENKVALLYGIENRFEPPPISSDIKLAVIDIPVSLENQHYGCMPDTLTSITLAAEDNCGGYITATNIEASNNASGCVGDPIIIDRMWIFDDGSSNSDTLSQLIHVENDTPPTLTCIDNTIQLSNEEDYLLSVDDVLDLDSSYANCNNDLNILDISPSLINYDEIITNPVNITVTAVDECGLQASCNSSITVDVTTGLKPKKKNKFKLSPNPAASWINLTFDEPIQTELTYSLWNSIGQLVKKGDVKAGNSFTKIDISEFTSGLYIIHLYTNSARYPYLLTSDKVSFIKN